MNQNYNLDSLEPTPRELEAFQKYLEEKNKPFYKKVWDVLVVVLGYIVYGVSLIIGFIIGVGGCLWELFWIILCFVIGWWFLSGIWNWIF